MIPLIKQQHFLQRERIQNEMIHIFQYPLTIAVAAMGYGKTTAVRDFLDRVNSNYILLSIEQEESSPQLIWDSLMRQMMRVKPDLGNKLQMLGFPSNTAQVDKVKQIIEDDVYLSNVILVIDDYHLAHSPELDGFLERIIRSRIDGFHIVLLSRTTPELPVEEFMLKNFCYIIKNTIFEFTSDEIREYFNLYGFHLSEKELKMVFQLSEGWISAVYLLMQRYAETGLLDSERSIERLLESAVMPQYSCFEISLLKSICIFETITPEQAIYITKIESAAQILFNLCESNSFINYDAQAGVFRIHNIFNNYLRKLFNSKTSSVDSNQLFERCGTWYVRNGDILSGLNYYLKGKRYDLILNEFEKTSITKVFDSSPDIIQRLFQDIPFEIKYLHPSAFIAYIGFFVTNIDIVSGKSLLSEIELLYQNDSQLSQETKQKISGEIALIRAYTAFNDSSVMFDQFKSAHDLLNGQSHIANKNKIVTFGSPHVLYMYYRSGKKLMDTVDKLEALSPYYQDLSGGCGIGFEYQLRSEYYLETGEFEKAELFAYKSIYKARTTDQIALIICSNLTLIRNLAYKGNIDEALDILDSLSAEIEERNSPIMSSSFDLCAGYFYSLKGEEKGFANWLKNGDIEKSDVLYQGSGFNYIVYGKYLLIKRDFIRLEVLVEEMLSIFNIFDNQFGYLHAYLLDSAAKYHLYGPEAGATSLINAIKIGEPDGIILPFAEYKGDILETLILLDKSSNQSDYFRRLVMLTKQYMKSSISNPIDKPKAINLTPRETQMLHLVSLGKTNREIAAELYIAEVTVRKTLTSTYRKLGTSGRAAAVKKALELGLI